MQRYRVTIIALALAIPWLSLQAQSFNNPFEEFIRQNVEQIYDSLADPYVKAFGSGVTGGIFRSADTHGTLGFDVGARTMFILIPSGESSVLDTTGLAAIPIPCLQANVGLPMGVEAMVRGLGFKYKGAAITLLGIGLKKNFRPYIPVPMFPDLAVQVSYHRFQAKDVSFTLEDVYVQEYGLSTDLNIEASDMISSNHWSLDFIVSKKLSLLVVSIQPYAGFGVDWTTMEFGWTFSAVNQPSLQPVSLSESTKVRSARLTLGLDVSPFPFVHVFGDYNFGKFPQATIGAAISFR